MQKNVIILNFATRLDCAYSFDLPWLACDRKLVRIPYQGDSCIIVLLGVLKQETYHRPISRPVVARRSNHLRGSVVDDELALVDLGEGKDVWEVAPRAVDLVMDVCADRGPVRFDHILVKDINFSTRCDIIGARLSQDVVLGGIPVDLKGGGRVKTVSIFWGLQQPIANLEEGFNYLLIILADNNRFFQGCVEGSLQGQIISTNLSARV